jgi:hypothetical protein
MASTSTAAMTTTPTSEREASAPAAAREPASSTAVRKAQSSASMWEAECFASIGETASACDGAARIAAVKIVSPMRKGVSLVLKPISGSACAERQRMLDAKAVHAVQSAAILPDHAASW